MLVSTAFLATGRLSSTTGFLGGGGAEPPPSAEPGRLGRSLPPLGRSRFNTGRAVRLPPPSSLRPGDAGLFEGRDGGETKRGLSCPGRVAPEVVTIFSGAGAVGLAGGAAGVGAVGRGGLSRLAVGLPGRGGGVASDGLLGEVGLLGLLGVGAGLLAAGGVAASGLGFFASAGGVAGLG